MSYHFEKFHFLYRVNDIRKQSNVNAYDICKFLYEIVSGIPNTHAFYVGLYNEYINQIGFPYTCDEGKWDRADYRPLGDGPTSWVIRNRKPFILTDENSKQHQSGSHFGNTGKTSESALHYPMFTTDSSKDTVLVGVISIQSYKPNNYKEEEIDFFELIARTAGELFLPFIEAETVKSLYDKLSERDNKLNYSLYEITEEINRIKQLINRPAPSSDILKYLETVADHCRELQSTIAIGEYEISSLKEKTKSDLLGKLTPTEKKVVERFLEHKEENKDIANALTMSYDSVKKHIQKVCEKLNIEDGREGLYNLFKT